MAAEAHKWQTRVLQQWNANLSSFDTIHPAVAPMPPGWNMMPVQKGNMQCNNTGWPNLLFQGFDLRAGCTQRCIANANCHFMTYNKADDWCQLSQNCSGSIPHNGLGTPRTWEKPTRGPSDSGNSTAGNQSQFSNLNPASSAVIRVRAPTGSLLSSSTGRPLGQSARPSACPTHVASSLPPPARAPPRGA